MSVSQHDLESLANDYEATTGSRVSSFYCPILLRDEDVQLCKGHVIGKQFEDSSRKTVVQRADIDSFYGRCFESRLYDFARTRRKNLVQHLNDPNLSRRFPIRIEHDGKTLPHYQFTGRIHPSHKLIQISDDNGNSATVALKAGNQDQPLSESKL